MGGIEDGEVVGEGLVLVEIREWERGICVHGCIGLGVGLMLWWWEV